MKRTVKLFTAPAILAIALLAPADASAQTCFGLPTAAGQSAIMGQLGLPDGATSYGVKFAANTTGPFAYGVSYALTDIDDVDSNMHTLKGEVGYKLESSSALKVCPMTGLGFSRISEGDASLTQFSIPVGASLGAEFQATPEINVIPFVAPALVWSRLSGDGIESSSDTEFNTTLGATAVLQRFFVSGGISLTTADDEDSFFSISFGTTF